MRGSLLYTNSSTIHLIVGGSGILGYALALAISQQQEDSRIFILSRKPLPSYFLTHTRATHILFDNHNLSSITTLLHDVTPAYVWYLLSDNNNSTTASLSSSTLTNLVFPSMWFSTLVDVLPSARFIYSSSTLSTEANTSYYSASKSSMSSFLSNPIISNDASCSIFFPTSLFGPGEQRTSRLIPSIIYQLRKSSFIEDIGISPNIELVYSSSLELARSLVSSCASPTFQSVIGTDCTKYHCTSSELISAIAQILKTCSKLSHEQLLFDYNQGLTNNVSQTFEFVLRLSVWHHLIYTQPS